MNSGMRSSDCLIFHTNLFLPVMELMIMLKSGREALCRHIPDTALPHWDLIKKYDIIDFELGIKLTGAGFPVYKGKGAKLQRALISFFLDEGEKAGYSEVMPPILVNEDSGFGTGQLPDKEGQMYHATLDNFYLVPTAEVPVTNIYRDVILNAEMLPVKEYCIYTLFQEGSRFLGSSCKRTQPAASV